MAQSSRSWGLDIRDVMIVGGLVSAAWMGTSLLPGNNVVIGAGAVGGAYLTRHVWLGGLFLMFWVVYSCIMCVFMGIVFVFVQPFHPILFKRFAMELADFYWKGMVWTTEEWAGIRVVLTGQDVPTRETVLLVANHLSYTDWLILFSAASRKGRLGCCKFFVKDIVKYMPGIGWGLVFLDSVFLARNWNKDEARIASTFRTLQTTKVPAWLITFLEGTRLTPEKLTESQEYAAKHGLPVFRHHLVPRMKGFLASIQGLRTNYLQAVYDVCIGYEGGRVPSLFQILYGKPCTRTVHLHIRRFAIDDLPLDPDKLTDWVMNVYREKDALMEEFYSMGRFPGTPLSYASRHIPLQLYIGWHPQ